MADKDPFEFKRGATFMVVMNLPESVPLNYFADWEATAQIRKAGNDNQSGLIGNLDFTWTDIETSRQFTLSAETTDQWPVGPAEIDVRFASAANGRVATTRTVKLDITRNITK